MPSPIDNDVYVMQEALKWRGFRQIEPWHWIFDQLSNGDLIELQVVDADVVILTILNEGFMVSPSMVVEGLKHFNASSQE